MMPIFIPLNGGNIKSAKSQLPPKKLTKKSSKKTVKTVKNKAKK